MSDLDLETRHRVALAREMCAAAGVPLRDRWGFASSDQAVARVVEVVFMYPQDRAAVEALFSDALDGGGAVAEAYEFPSEEFHFEIVRALRPLVEDRRRAAERAQRLR